MQYLQSQVISDIEGENSKHQHREATHGQSLIYAIEDIPHKDYLQIHQLEDLRIPLAECPTCLRGTLYPDIDDAYHHLKQFHFQQADSVTNEEKYTLSHWLSSTAAIELERRNMEIIRLIRTIHHRASRLLQKAIGIRNSVANEKKEKDPRYLLPSALVKASGKIFQFVYTALHTVRYLRAMNDEVSVPPDSMSSCLQNNIALAETMVWQRTMIYLWRRAS